MRHIIPILISLLFVSALRAQDSLNVADSLAHAPDSYQYREISRRPFFDSADLLRADTDFNRLHFAEPGRPVFMAFANFWPRQSSIYLNGLPLNESVTGLFNMGNITPDVISRVYGGTPTDSTSPGHDVDLFLRYKNSDEPYTRLNYYEGDFGLGNFNAYFSRRYGKRLNVQLAGQNLGYDGWASRLFSERFSYHARFDYQVDSLKTISFFYNLSKNKSQMRNTGAYDDYAFKTSFSRYHLRYRDKGAGGFQMDFAWSPTAYRLSSVADSFAVSVNSERFMARFSKPVFIGSREFRFTALLNNARYGGTRLKSGFYNEISAALDNIWPLTSRLSWSNRLLLKTRERQQARADFFSTLYWQAANQRASLRLSQKYRYPLPGEQFFKTAAFASPPLSEERLRGARADYIFSPLPGWRMKGHAALYELNNEIEYDSLGFFNRAARRWTEAGLSGRARLGWFYLEAAYRRQWADLNIQPRDRWNAQISYHDGWFADRMIFDLTLGYYGYRGLSGIYFQPLFQRFYSDGITDETTVHLFYFKGVLSVSDVQFYMETDNIASFDYSIVRGYTEQLRRVRFGVNWELFN